MNEILTVNLQFNTDLLNSVFFLKKPVSPLKFSLQPCYNILPVVSHLGFVAFSFRVNLLITSQWTGSSEISKFHTQVSPKAAMTLTSTKRLMSFHFNPEQEKPTVFTYQHDYV